MGAVRQKGCSSNCLKASIVKTHSLKDLESNGMVAAVLRIDPYILQHQYPIDEKTGANAKLIANLRDHTSTKNMQFDTSEMCWNRAFAPRQ